MVDLFATKVAGVMTTDKRTMKLKIYHPTEKQIIKMVLLFNLKRICIFGTYVHSIL